MIASFVGAGKSTPGRECLILPDSNRSQTLCSTAEAYLTLNYSVIPIYGDADPTRPKVASIEWGVYQRRRPTLTEIQNWFVQESFGGIAIVTGGISRLAVLDFDTEDSFRDFRSQYPDLAELNIVQTRRGYHIYFQVPPHLRLPSRKGHNIDLLSDGRYVVARPTCIDGHTYKLIRGGQPKLLSPYDIDRIMRFLNAGGVHTITAPKREFARFSSDSEGVPRNDRHGRNSIITGYDLQQIYLSNLEKKDDRNESLFRTSLYARDGGMAAFEVITALGELHANQPPVKPHRQETREQRYQEAMRTIHSAFSRPPQHRYDKSPQNVSEQLPNSVRERLLKSGQTRTVRVIEGLRLKGIKSGDIFTTNEALELLQGIVGRDSIYAALKATAADGQSIFSRENPSPRPPTPANAAIDPNHDTTKCFIGSAAKSGKSPAHRPTVVYIMPSNPELCLRLGVKLSLSDPITLDDLATAKRTRMAVHRELIRRRPGNYPRRWLAKRLGISPDTLDVYNDGIPQLNSRPCFWKQRISWSNLNSVPDGIDVGGATLEDQTGRRYPARRQIAAILLGQGQEIVYKRQDVNYYWYGDTLPDLSIKLGLHPKWREHEAREERIKQFVRQYQSRLDLHSVSAPSSRPGKPLPKDSIGNRYAKDSIQFQPDPHADAMVPIQRANDDTAPKITSTNKASPHRANYRKPLPDAMAEALAIQVYNRLNALSSDPAKHISQVTARRLVDLYGNRAVEDALVRLATRQNIMQPVGFLITVLKSEAKGLRLRAGH